MTSNSVEAIDVRADVILTIARTRWRCDGNREIRLVAGEVYTFKTRVRKRLMLRAIFRPFSRFVRFFVASHERVFR